MTASVTPIGVSSETLKLRITEIFASLQGESVSVGIPTVFVRLTGCPLRCQYCDTAYAFSGGEWMQQEDILTKVNSFQLKHVTVTGGEPLAQKNCLQLLKSLCEQGFNVSLETSGALDVSKVDPRVVKVLDIKTPASQEMEKNNWGNVHYLHEKDQVKFVICNYSDYIWAKNIITEYQLRDRCEILFSPCLTEDKNIQPISNESLSKQLAEWILNDQLDVRFQLQLHKIL